MTSAFLQKANRYLFYLILLFLPTQFGKHFFPDFATVSGLRIDYLAPTVYTTDIFVLLFLSTALILYLKNLIQLCKQPVIFVGKYKLSIVFLILLLVNIHFALNELEAWYGLAKFCEFTLFAFATSQALSKAIIKPILRIFSITIILESILASIQFFHQSALGGVMYFLGERFITPSTPGAANASLNGMLVLRPYGTFPHPNVLAGFLVLGMTFLTVFTSAKSFTAKWLFYLTISIGSFALLLSLSRTAIVVWCLFLLYFFVLRNVQQLKKRSAVTLLAVLGIALFIFFLSPLHFRFVGQLLTDESVTEREQLLSVAFEMIKNHPFLGVGINNFLSEIPTYSQTALIQPVHNIFVLVLSEIGIIGCLFILYFCFQTFTVLRKKNEASKTAFFYATTFSLIEVCLLGQTDHYFLTLQQGQLLLAFLLGCAYTKHIS